MGPEMDPMVKPWGVAGCGVAKDLKGSVAAGKAHLEAAGVEFIPENGGGPGVRLRERTGD